MCHSLLVSGRRFCQRWCWLRSELQPVTDLLCIAFYLYQCKRGNLANIFLKALKVFLVTAESSLNENTSIYCMQVQSCCLWPSYPMSKKSIVLVLLILHLCEQCSPWGLAEETWSIILISAAMQKYSCSWWPCVRPSRTHRLLFDFWRLLLELFLAAGYKTQPRRLKNMKEHVFRGGDIPSPSQEVRKIPHSQRWLIFVCQPLLSQQANSGDAGYIAGTPPHPCFQNGTGSLEDRKIFPKCENR